MPCGRSLPGGHDYLTVMADYLGQSTQGILRQLDISGRLTLNLGTLNSKTFRDGFNIKPRDIEVKVGIQGGFDI